MDKPIIYLNPFKLDGVTETTPAPTGEKLSDEEHARAFCDALIVNPHDAEIARLTFGLKTAKHLIDCLDLIVACLKVQIAKKDDTNANLVIEIVDLQAKIERQRALAKAAYEEGWEKGCDVATDRERPVGADLRKATAATAAGDWEKSQTFKLLKDGLPE